jgi:hypothetical protein
VLQAATISTLFSRQDSEAAFAIQETCEWEWEGDNATVLCPIHCFLIHRQPTPEGRSAARGGVGGVSVRTDERGVVAAAAAANKKQIAGLSISSILVSCVLQNALPTVGPHLRFSTGAAAVVSFLASVFD